MVGQLAGCKRTGHTTEAFAAHRNLLFTVASEMLGSAADAEDVLQETWPRWAGIDLGTVRVSVRTWSGSHQGLPWRLVLRRLRRRHRCSGR
jgi:DNA-directed RNA polymerase specialized sigma24 family protein